MNTIREVRTRFMNTVDSGLIYKLNTRILSEYFHIAPTLATAARFQFGKFLDPALPLLPPLVQYELLRFIKEHFEHVEWSTGTSIVSFGSNSVSRWRDFVVASPHQGQDLRDRRNFTDG